MSFTPSAQWSNLMRGAGRFEWVDKKNISCYWAYNMQSNEGTKQTLRAGSNTPSHPKIVAAVQIYIWCHQNEGRFATDRQTYKRKRHNSRTVLLILSTERTQPSISSDSEQGVREHTEEYCRACRKQGEFFWLEHRQAVVCCQQNRRCRSAAIERFRARKRLHHRKINIDKTDNHSPQCSQAEIVELETRPTLEWGGCDVFQHRGGGGFDTHGMHRPGKCAPSRLNFWKTT